MTAINERLNSGPKLLAWIAGNAASLANGGTTTPFAFDLPDAFDPEGLHDPSSNNSRLSIPRTGWYLATLNFVTEALASGTNVSVVVTKNGTTPTIVAMNLQSGYDQVGTRLIIAGTPMVLTSGDYLELGNVFAGYLYQNSGSSKLVAAEMQLWEIPQQ